MNFSYRLAAVLIGAAVVMVQPQQVAALPPAQVSDIAKEFTVLIGGDGAGSGVIFERKGDTYFVITNRHVVSKDGKYEIQTFDGTRHPVYRSQELPGLDLAVLQFTSNKNYRLANLGNSDQIKEGVTVYVVGWADGLPGISERSYQFTDGNIRSRLKNPDEGYSLVYDNEAIPGMSGGPVLDENGRVVGINGRADTEVRKDGTLVAVLRLGIPINTFLAARKTSQPVTGTQATAQQPSAKPNLNTAGGQTNISKAPTATRQPRTEEFISLGGAKANRGDYRGAIADYNQALKISPQNPDAYYRRGVAYNQLEQYQEALEDFNQVVRLSPKNTFAYAYRGIVRMQLKDFKGALTDGDQTIRLDPNANTSILGYIVRAGAHLGLGDNQKALADLQKVQDQINKIKLSLGNNPQALADLQKAQDQLNSVRQQLGTGSASQPATPSNQPHNQTALQPATPSNQPHNQTAIAAATQAIQQNPKDANAYFNRAAVRYQQGEKRGALEDLNQGTRFNPRHSLAWTFRGDLLRELGRNEEAITSYNRAIQANSEWGKLSIANAYNNRADTRSEQGDYRGAIADFDKVISLQPKNAAAYALRGLNHQRQGNNQAAVKDFNSAVRLDPNNAIAYLARGFSYHLQGDYQGALAAYEKTIAQDAKLLPAVNNLGLIKYELQDLQGAIRQFQAAIAINNTFAEPQLALAVALYAKGDRERGLAMAEAALRLDNRFANLEFLKKNLWGDRILSDTQKLLQSPKIRALTPRPSRK